MRITHQRDATLPIAQLLIEGLKQQNLATVISAYADDTVFMPPNEPSLYGKAEVQEWFQEYFENFRIIELSETERHVSMFEDNAVERWGYQIKLRPVSGGRSIRDEGRFLRVWKRDPQKGWLITQSMWNSIKPIGAGTSRFIALMRKRGEGPADTL